MLMGIIGASYRSPQVIMKDLASASKYKLRTEACVCNNTMYGPGHCPGAGAGVSREEEIIRFMYMSASLHRTIFLTNHLKSINPTELREKRKEKAQISAALVEKKGAQLFFSFLMI